jgi:hypothetical protein
LGLKLGVEVAVLLPQCKDLPKQFGHAVPHGHIVTFARRHQSREQRFDGWVPFRRRLSRHVEKSPDEVIAFAAHVEDDSAFGLAVAVCAGHIDFFREDSKVADEGRCGSKAIDRNDLGDQRGGGVEADAWDCD